MKVKLIIASLVFLCFFTRLYPSLYPLFTSYPLYNPLFTSYPLYNPLYTLNTLSTLQVIPLPEVKNPFMIQVEDRRLYVVEGPDILIYRLEDMALQKRFGGFGDNPWQFNKSPVSNVPVSIDVLPEKVLVESFGRVTVFTGEGVFIENHRPNEFFSGMVPLDEHFIALRYIRKNRRWFRVLDLYNNSFQRVREIFRNKTPGHWRQRKDPVGSIFIYGAVNGKIFLATEKDFIIDFYDAAGKKERTIIKPYQPVKVSRDFIDSWFKIREERQGADSRSARIQRRIVRFPEYFPAIRGIFPDGDRLYVETWELENNRSRYVVLNSSGDTVGTVHLPQARKDAVTQYPRCIHNGTYYRLMPGPADGGAKHSWVLYVDRVGK
jgi:hypothetical protein